jgi:hypothetical protein
MALVVSGPMVGFSGTVDGYTYSQQPNGTTVVKKKNSKSSKAPTLGQLAVRADTTIFNQLMEPLKTFVKVGYEQEAKRSFKNPYNMMVKHCKTACIEGVYPNRQVNYSKVLITKGELPMPKKVGVKMTAKGLAFNWSTELLPKITHQSDQVMMLAYFPELKETRYMTAGAQRLVGRDLLPLEGIENGYTAEVYISFTSDDRIAIADSIHLGQFNW